MSEEIKDAVEAPTEVEMQFSHSPVSDIINNVWRGPTEEPPTLKRVKGKNTVKPKSKGPAILEVVEHDADETPAQSADASTQPSGVTIQLTGEQLIAIFDGLKLLLAKLSSSDPQPLQAIYVTTGLIQGLEGVTVAQLRALMEAHS